MKLHIFISIKALVCTLFKLMVISILKKPGNSLINRSVFVAIKKMASIEEWGVFYHLNVNIEDIRSLMVSEE